MKETTRQRKKASKGMEAAAYGRQWLAEQLYVILARGKIGRVSVYRGSEDTGGASEIKGA